MGTWVPMGKRCPAKEGVYLVTDKEVFTTVADLAKTYTRYRVMPLYWAGGAWKCLDSGNYGFAYPVLAWMSLPTAYKEER